MLVFDSELFCIPVAEADVVELYRSPDAVSLSDEDVALPPGLAFVCVLNREGGYQVFAAFYFKDIKRSLVYVVDPSAGGQPSYDAPLKKAFAFTEMMGFTMEAVSLKYGTAMREVVLRAVPALLSPENADRLRREREAELAELEKLVADHAADDCYLAGDSALSPDKQVELKRAREKREEAAKAAARKLAMEKRQAEQTGAVERAIDKFLAQVNADEMADVERAERERLMVENSTMKARSRELEQTVRRLEGQVEVFRAEAGKKIAELEEEVRVNRKKGDAEQAERKQLEKEKKAADRRLVELEQALREVRQEAEVERTEKERIARAMAAVEKRNAELAEEARAAKQKTESREGVHKEIDAVRAETDKRIAELEEAVREARELVESERFERELLVREKMAAEKRIEELELKVGEAEALPEPEKAAQEQADIAGTQIEKRIRELEQAADLAREQAGKERAERERLAKEHALAESRAAKLEKALREAEDRTAEGRQSEEDVSREIAELREALQKSEDRIEYLRLEIERIAAAKAAAETRVAELEATGGRAERKNPEGRPGPQASAENRGVSPAPPSDGGDVSPPPHVVRRPPPKGAFFHVDWDLTRIDYASPEDILEVHQSMNLVQLSLEGYHSQHCSAHIVAMKKGKTRQVHVAFGLSESGRTLIYSPAKPIQNKADYARAISEAVKFLEVVGYMPEKLQLGKSPPALARDLSGIPVLSGPQEQAQGF